MKINSLIFLKKTWESYVGVFYLQFESFKISLKLIIFLDIQVNSKRCDLQNPWCKSIHEALRYSFQDPTNCHNTKHLAGSQPVGRSEGCSFLMKLYEMLMFSSCKYEILFQKRAHSWRNLHQDFVDHIFCYSSRCLKI